MAARKTRGLIFKPPSGIRADLGKGIATRLHSLWTFSQNTRAMEDAGPYRFIASAVGTGAGNSAAGGKFGNSIKMDGSANSGYTVTSTFPNALNFIPPFSVSAWLNTPSSATGAIVGNTFDALEFRINTSQQIEILREDSASMATSTGTVSFNIWTHVGMSMDLAGIWALYINGKRDSTGTTAGTFGLASGNTYIGTAGNGEGFVGILDLVAQWRRILTPNEFSMLYADPLVLLQRPCLRLRSGAQAAGGVFTPYFYQMIARHGGMSTPS